LISAVILRITWQSWLKRTIRRLQLKYKPIICGYASKKARNKRCRGMARNLLKAWPALWTFAAHDGVEPTNNNHAERVLRGAVIYRKLSLGSQSTGGEQRNRTTPISTHHLPPTTQVAIRQSQRRPRRPRPRRPRAPTHSPNPLNAYKKPRISRTFREIPPTGFETTATRQIQRIPSKSRALSSLRSPEIRSDWCHERCHAGRKPTGGRAASRAASIWSAVIFWSSAITSIRPPA
jgi:hypothetical protein